MRSELKIGITKSYLLPLLQNKFATPHDSRKKKSMQSITACTLLRLLLLRLEYRS